MKKSYKVVISSEAAQNIEEAYVWIAQSNERVALRWYEGIVDAMKSLARLPLRCAVSPESELGLVDDQVHQLLYGSGHWKYRILFTVEGEEVRIAHVRHGARLLLGQTATENDE